MQVKIFILGKHFFISSYLIMRKIQSNQLTNIINYSCCVIL